MRFPTIAGVDPASGRSHLEEQTILVTGVAGFIGSHVAHRLATLGYRVIGCDNFNDYYCPDLKYQRVRTLLAPVDVPCMKLELADAAEVRTLFERTRPAYVVHLAAQAGVRHSLIDPGAYVQSNLVGFANVLESCRRHGVHHLLYASSSSVYGDNAKVPFSEDDRTDEPLSLYAATKKSNELMAHSYSHLFGIPATGMRFFTAYGPWGRPDMAYFDFLSKMSRDEPITVFAEGLLSRDFTCIDDIVEAVVRLLFKPPPAGQGIPHAVFNIGNSSPVRVLDLIRALERASGIRARLDFQPIQPGDVAITYADTSKLSDWIGFVPTTPLDIGIERFHRWYAETWQPMQRAADGLLVA